MRQFTCTLLIAFLSVWVQAQTPSQNIDVTLLSGGHMNVEQVLNITLPPGDSVQFQWDLPAWTDAESHLRNELLHAQDVDLHYAKGYSGVSHIVHCAPIPSGNWIFPSLIFNSEFGTFVNTSPDTIRQLRLKYTAILPEWKYANQGQTEYFAGMNRPFIRWKVDSLSNWLSEPANFYGYDHPQEVLTSLNVNNPGNFGVLTPGQFGLRKSNIHRSTTLHNAPSVFSKPQWYEYRMASESDSVAWIYDSALPALDFNAVILRLKRYVARELGTQWPNELNIALAEDWGNLRSTQEGILFVEWSDNPVELELNILESLIENIFGYQLKTNAYEHPWMVEGMSHYHHYRYQEEHFPEARLLGPYSSSMAARFLDLEDLKPTYFHRWLYLFMARQGLDQPLSDSALALAPFNREAVMRGKAGLALGTLRGYAGERAFLRGVHRWLESGDEISPENLQKHIQFFSNVDLAWFTGDLYRTTKVADYHLLDVDQCSYLVLARIENHGGLSIPYSTIGYNREGEPVFEEWHEGHTDERDIQLYTEEYSKVEIDPGYTTPDLDGQNQMRKPTGLFQAWEPIRFQFYSGLDQNDKTQIYWLPSLKFNAYDGVLAGLTFYNRTLLPKRWEYRIGPEYSTRTGQLTGSASLRYYRPLSSGYFHAIESGVYTRYFHYDEGLSYFRYSPGVNLHVRKSHPRSHIQQTFKFRGVGVNRELRPEDRDIPNVITNARYFLVDGKYIRENQHILHPSRLEADVQWSNTFTKLSVSFRQRFMLPNKQWLGIRVFAGTFLNNAQPADQPFFSFGASGTQDYLFDYSFIGRSDSTGIWSQQFFVSDGGFKSQTHSFSSTWMTTASLNVPVWKGLGVFGDVGYNGYTEQLMWDYGIRLAIVPDFLEVYFPFQNHLSTPLLEPNYFSSIRFILNINQTDIIQRLRRGWY